MIRNLGAVAVVMCLCSMPVHAQSTVFTVSAASAEVHKGPSMGAPVIGHSDRGTPLEVTRELGSWVKVSWPAAPDGIGYVHMSTGAISHPSAAAGAPAAAASASSRPEPRSAMPPPTSLRGTGTAAQEQPMFKQPVYVTPATHIIGLGGQVGRIGDGYGGSARGWQKDRLGIQFAVSHYDLTNASTAGHVSSLQWEPSALYSLPNKITDSVWLRPYVGSGLNFNHQTWTSAVLGAGPSISDNSTGLRAFGGSEITFAGVPQVAISTEFGYHWAHSSFPGVEVGGLGLTISGHWYVK